jgi:hypothetical protein
VLRNQDLDNLSDTLVERQNFDKSQDSKKYVWRNYKLVVRIEKGNRKGTFYILSILTSPTGCNLVLFMYSKEFLRGKLLKQDNTIIDI